MFFLSKSRLLLLTLPVLALFPVQPAWAQTKQVQARVARKLNIVKTRPRNALSFFDAAIGQTLFLGDNLRTGLRSQAELQYSDRSLLRIPESSDVIIRTGYQRDVNIQAGAVYGSYRGPGRFRSRDAVAAVRGTKVEVDVHGDRTRVRCFSGSVVVAPAAVNLITGFVRQGGAASFSSDDLVASDENWAAARVDVVNARGERVQQSSVAKFDPATGTVTLAAALPNALLPGASFILINPPSARYVILKPREETTISGPLGLGPLPPRPTAPEQFAGVQEDPPFQDPLFRNEQTMVAGLVQERRQRSLYELIVARDASQVYGVFSPGVQTRRAVSSEQGGLSAGVGSAGDKGGLGTGVGNGTQGNGGLGTGVGNGAPGNGGLGTDVGNGVNGNGNLGAGVGNGGGNGGLGAGVGNGAQGNGGLGTGVGSGPTGNGGLGAGIGSGPTGNGGVGIGIGNGAQGNGGLLVTIGRSARALYPRAPQLGGVGYSSTVTDTTSGYLDTAFVVGDVYAEFAGRYGVLNRREDSQLDTFFVRYRNERVGDIRLGRFHWFPGPVSNGELGRLTSFTTSDGLLWRLPATDYAQVQLAYWDKMNPLYGPRIGGYQARVELPTLRGRTGVTLLTTTASHHALGYAVDTVFPVLPQRLDLYGEAGADTFGKGFFSLGAYLPGLFHRFRVDFALEYANRGSFGGEFDVSATVPFARYFTALLLLSKPDHDDLNPGFGLQMQF